MNYSLLTQISSKHSLLDRQLFVITGVKINGLSLLLFGAIIILSFLASLLIQSIAKKALAEKFSHRMGTLKAFLRLVHYFIIIIGFLIALRLVGIDLSALFAAGAVFAIAIGFAMQTIIQNFVSGVILLLERSIKPGDVLEIDGQIVTVMDMGIRTTVVRTLREEELIMPNSVLSQSTVKNFTMRDEQFMLGVNVGVSYESDVDKVIAVLQEVGLNMTWSTSAEKVTVRFQEFGASSLDFGLYIQIKEPWKQRQYMSELRLVIWNAFKANQIVIAYPQLDMHLHYGDKKLMDMADLNRLSSDNKVVKNA